MAKVITISINEETDNILGEMKKLNLNKSGSICSLLKFYKEKGFRIPKGEPAI